MLKTSLALSIFMAALSAAEIRVTITNLAPQRGTFLTPFWVGFHNGSFDIYNLGEPASPALERLAEDGTLMPIMTDFSNSGAGSVQGALGGGAIAPGTSVSATFVLNAFAAASRYFSYASMIIPSNDAFIANANPMAFEVFSGGGMFQMVDAIVMGTMVRDAGTEDNDELPANTAFLGQVTPDTGVTSNGVITVHPGFLPNGNILNAFPNSDFTAQGYQIARIQIEQVPEPSTWALAGVSLALLAFRRHRR